MFLDDYIGVQISGSRTSQFAMHPPLQDAFLEQSVQYAEGNLKISEYSCFFCGLFK